MKIDVIRTFFALASCGKEGKTRLHLFLSDCKNIKEESPPEFIIITSKDSNVEANGRIINSTNCDNNSIFGEPSSIPLLNVGSSTSTIILRCPWSAADCTATPA